MCAFAWCATFCRLIKINCVDDEEIVRDKFYFLAKKVKLAKLQVRSAALMLKSVPNELLECRRGANCVKNVNQRNLSGQA